MLISQQIEFKWQIEKNNLNWSMLQQVIVNTAGEVTGKEEGM
jgi:hypothetical protein